jgi:hypothetical protein
MGSFVGGGGFSGGGAGMAPSFGSLASGFAPQPNFANPMMMAPGMPMGAPNVMQPPGMPVGIGQPQLAPPGMANPVQPQMIPQVQPRPVPQTPAAPAVRPPPPQIASPVPQAPRPPQAAGVTSPPNTTTLQKNIQPGRAVVPQTPGLPSFVPGWEGQMGQLGSLGVPGGQYMQNRPVPVPPPRQGMGAGRSAQQAPNLPQYDPGLGSLPLNAPMLSKLPAPGQSKLPAPDQAITPPVMPPRPDRNPVGRYSNPTPSTPTGPFRNPNRPQHQNMMRSLDPMGGPQVPAPPMPTPKPGRMPMPTPNPSRTQGLQPGHGALAQLDQQFDLVPHMGGAGPNFGPPITANTQGPTKPMMGSTPVPGVFAPPMPTRNPMRMGPPASPMPAGGFPPMPTRNPTQRPTQMGQQMAPTTPMPSPVGTPSDAAGVGTARPGKVAPGYTVSTPEVVNYIAQAAQARGIDPATAIKVFKGEGASNWQGQATGGKMKKYKGKEDSWGPYQLYLGGGLGNQAPFNVRDPSTWKLNVDFALDNALKSGWAPWYGAARMGVGNWQGLR